MEWLMHIGKFEIDPPKTNSDQISIVTAGSAVGSSVGLVAGAFITSITGATLFFPIAGIVGVAAGGIAGLSLASHLRNKEE